MNEAKGNSKGIWKSINSLTGRVQHRSHDIQLTVQGKTIDDSATITSTFNSFFIESVQELGNNFRSKEQNSNLNVVGQGFNLDIVSEEEVRKVICSLRNSKSRDALHQNTVFIKKNQLV